MGRARAVEVRARLPAQVQQMLEAGRRHERRARALPLEQGVRRHGRAVREALDVAGAGRPRGGDDRLLLPRGRQHLGRAELAAVEHDGIGEGAADVDAEDRHGRSIPPATLASWRQCSSPSR